MFEISEEKMEQIKNLLGVDSFVINIVTDDPAAPKGLSAFLSTSSAQVKPGHMSIMVGIMLEAATMMHKTMVERSGAILAQQIVKEPGKKVN